MNPTFSTNYREMPPWLETILNDYQDAVIITDKHFERLHWNVAAEELWFQQTNRPAGKNVIAFLDLMFPGYPEMQEMLEKVVDQDEPEEDIFLSTPNGKTYRLSCYTHKFPGTTYLLDVVIILRDLQTSRNELHPEQVLYKSLLNTLEEGVLLLQGEQGTIISANKKACEIIGVRKKQLIGQNLTDLAGKAFKEDGSSMDVSEFPPMVTLRTGEPVKQAIAGFKNSCGKITWVNVNTCLPDAHTSCWPGLTAVTFFDITARREAESRLTETEAIFSSFMNNTHSPAWIVDEDGSIIYMNDVFKNVWKLNDSHLNGNMHNLLPKEMIGEYIANNRRVLETGAPLITIEKSLRIDGTPGVYLVYKFLLKTSHSKRLIGGQSIDITDEKNAQEEIVKSNERFYYATKATSDSIWDWNLEKGHIYRSEPFTRLTGYLQKDIESNLYWWYEKIHEDDRKRVMAQINACLMSQNNYWHDEYRFRCADGSYKYLADKGYIIYKNGQAVRGIGAIQDLTEKRRLESELSHQKEKERIQINQAMIAGQDIERNEISKELHDNVNQILSSAVILLSVAKENPAEQAKLIEQSSEYLNLAIQEIRKISKSLNSSVINEVGFIEPVEDIIKCMKLAQKLNVQFECDPWLEEELSYDLQLMVYRIIQEQTNNIIRHAEADCVKIAIYKRDGFLNLLLQDNGKGFDKCLHANGIGLLNIRNRAETFGGSVHIDTQPGCGCKMLVKVPVI